MRKLSKILPLLLAGALCVFALAACAGGSGSSAASESSDAASSAAASPEAASLAAAPQSSAAAEPVAGGNAIVVYYSASGNTARVADEVAAAAGAPTFEITPVVPYTADDLYWQNEDSRVNREHEDERLRTVELTTTEIPNWDSYDTVFIGYPIWWAIAAWPVGGFVKANDFTGKTVIPFCTSTSSGIGQSGQLLAQLAGTGDWQPGMRFASSADQAEVSEWVGSLGL